MADVGYAQSQLVHANNSFVTYGNRIIGKLEKLKMVVEKDAEYDVIIGSGGKPFGQPLLKFTKFYGSFTKGQFKIDDLDKVLALHSVGNAHSNFRSTGVDDFNRLQKYLFGTFNEHDPSEFNSGDVRKFIDEDTESLTFFPVATESFAIAFGGVIITKFEFEIVTNKFVSLNAEFKGKSIEYHNKLKIEELRATLQ